LNGYRIIRAGLVVTVLVAIRVSLAHGDVRYSAGVVTSAPVFAGIEGKGEWNHSITARVGLGWLPDPYLKLINKFVVAVGGYDSSTAKLVEAAVDGSFVLRLVGGWRVWRHRGFEMGLGYTLVTGGGSLTGSEVIGAVTGRDLSMAGPRVPLETKLHALEVYGSWTWTVRSQWEVECGLGWFHTLYSQTNIGATTARRDRMLAQSVQAAEDYLDKEVLQKWAFTPEFRIAARYVF